MKRTFVHIATTIAVSAALVLVPVTQAHAVTDEVPLSFPTLVTSPEDESCVIAANDSATTAVDTPVTVAVLDNDSNDCGIEIDAVHTEFALTMFVGSFGQGTNGSVSQVGDSLKYTPNAGFTGVDHFTYSACVLINNQLQICDPATVTITIPALATTVATVLGTTIVNTDPTVLAATLARTGGNTNSQGQTGFVFVLLGSTFVGFAAFRRRQQIIGRYARR